MQCSLVRTSLDMLQRAPTRSDMFPIMNMNNKSLIYNTLYMSAHSRVDSRNINYNEYQETRRFVIVR